MSIVSNLLKIIALCVYMSVSMASEPTREKMAESAFNGTESSGYLLLALDTSGSDDETLQLIKALKPVAAVHIDTRDFEVNQRPSQTLVTHTNDFKTGFVKDGFKYNQRPTLSF